MEKTLEIHLAELREQIAQEIERRASICPYRDGSMDSMFRDGMETAAEIARGR